MNINNLKNTTMLSVFSKLRNNNPFPIELISFDAKLNGGEVELHWVRESEINNDYFT